MAKVLVLALTALALLVAGIVLLTRDGHDETGSGARPGAVAPGGGAAEPGDRPSADLSDGEGEARVEEPVIADSGPPPAGDDPEDATRPDPEPAVDDDPVGRLALRIVDEGGRAVPGARVRMEGLRPVDDPDLHFAWIGDVCEETTEADGRVEVWYARGLGRFGRTGAVSLWVEHDQFVPLWVPALTVEEARADLVLERGGLLIVSGWVEHEGQVIADVEPHLGIGSGVGPGDWQPVADGRPSSDRVRSGRHSLALSWDSPDGATYHSDRTELELAAGESRELHLRLWPPVVLEGRLDERVPRPVSEGIVELAPVEEGVGVDLALGRSWLIEVQPDGSFRASDLPRGEAEVVALCRGWASAPGTDGRILPLRVELDAEGDVVLPMEPTAGVAFSVVDGAGIAIGGAEVALHPTIIWASGVEDPILGREWAGTSGLDGLVALADVPPTLGMRLEVRHPEYRLRPGDEASDGGTPSLDLAPGEAHQRTLTLEPIGR